MPFTSIRSLSVVIYKKTKAHFSKTPVIPKRTYVTHDVAASNACMCERQIKDTCLQKWTCV